jgi:hypothetical protein
VRPTVVQAAGLAIGVALATIGVLPHHVPTITVVYEYTPDAGPVVEPLIHQYNDEAHELDGRRIVVQGVAQPSGDALRDITAGRTVGGWTPAASVWGGLGALQDSAISLEATVPSLMASPQTIALWKPCARELGWPDVQIGWPAILHLASTEGAGVPNCGGFVLGATYPDLSTSGLFALASWYALATDGHLDLGHLKGNRRAQVTVDHIKTLPPFPTKWWETSNEAVAAIARADITTVSGLYLQETSLITHNNNDPRSGFYHLDPKGMVAVYPSGGTFIADYPYYTVGEPTTSSQVTDAAQVFGAWLGKQVAASDVSAYGFRTGDDVVSPQQQAMFTQKGALPSSPDKVFPPLDPAVAQWMLAQWARCPAPRPCVEP